MSERARGYARERGGPRLYWELGGLEGGSPLMLVRGLARSSAYWLEFRDLLEERHRVLVFDNRGVGRSETPRIGWTTADMADDAATVLRASGVERAHVFGISLGGMIAQELALRHPHRVDRLVLSSTTAGGRFQLPLIPRTAAKMARSATMPFEDAIRYSAQFALSPAYLERTPEIVDIWVAIANSEPSSPRGRVGQLLAAARHDTVDRLPYLRHATLVVTGDADEMIDPQHSHRLAERLPSASLHTVAGAGHDIPTEQGAVMASMVSSFLTAQGGGATFEPER